MQVKIFWGIKTPLLAPPIHPCIFVLYTGDSRPDIQGGHSMNVVYDLRGGLGVKPPEGEGFFNFKVLKWLKIGTKHLKNA